MFASKTVSILLLLAATTSAFTAPSFGGARRATTFAVQKSAPLFLSDVSTSAVDEIASVVSMVAAQCSTIR
jgi:L-asparagine transporter-like permease